MSTMENLLVKFVMDSNRIEGIHRPATDEELEVSRQFLKKKVVGISDLQEFVDVCAPGRKLRRLYGMNVRVGRHVPPPGGSHIETALTAILHHANEGTKHPYVIHTAYETLHPFMDGNGRSGRILWAWQMLCQDIHPGLNLGFLHSWYYQSLDHSDGRKGGKDF